MNFFYIAVILLSVIFALIILLFVRRRQNQVGIDQISQSLNALAKGTIPTVQKNQLPKDFHRLIPTISDLSNHLDSTWNKTRRSKDEIAIIFDHLREGVIAIDQQQKVMIMNRTARTLFGFSDDLKVKSLIEIVKNEQISNLAAEATLQLAQRTFSFELQRPKKTDLKLYIIGMKAKPGEAAAVLIFYDVTEINQLERIRKDFVANVSHELKTPLTSIKGFVETLLMSRSIDPAQERKFLTIMKEDSDRLERLIHDVLELSKIESGELSGRIETVDLVNSINETLKLLDPQIQVKQIKVLQDFKKMDSKIQGNHDQLMQVFINLFDNAIKYNRIGGEIRVKLERSENHVKISIADSGVGISENQIGRIFERFFRVDPARSRELGGTGLGLAIAKHIIELHHGTIQCVSKVDQGTTFLITLPI